MALNQAIKFRYLAAQLTQTETIQFVNKLLNRPNNIIITALFNHFVHSLGNEVKSVNKLISNIIESRKKKPKQIPIQNMKLHQFPKQLIGETSSFLNQSDYINFSKTSRAIFLGSNSPNLLQKLDLAEIKNYSSINLRSFPAVKALDLNLNKFNKLIPSMNGLSTMNHLQSITLNGERKSDIDIDGFMQQNNINMTNVTKLDLSFFGMPTNPFPSSKMTKLMSKFANIQYLSLCDVQSDIDINGLKQRYQNLKGLQILLNKATTRRSIINEFGNQLEYLRFFHHGPIDLNLSNVDFGRLQELRLIAPTNKLINNILKTAVNLQKVDLSITEFMKSTETMEGMISCIKSCKSLKYIAIWANNKLIESILNGIERGLFETQKRKRKEMKIMINIECDEQFEPNDIMLNIGNIMNCFQSSEINDFMFILNVKEMDRKIDINGVMKKLQGLSPDFNVKRSDSKIIITNKNCKINGYKTQWMM